MPGLYLVQSGWRLYCITQNERIMKPKNVKQAFEHDYRVKRINHKFNKKIEVCFEKRFHRTGWDDFVSFWIDRDYFIRNYPDTSERFFL